MKKLNKIKIILFIMFMLVIRNSYSAYSPGTTGAAFLKMGQGARATALAGAYTAVSDDVYSLYYNPAGLAINSDLEFTTSHFEKFNDINYEFLGIKVPLKNNKAIGFAVSMMHSDDLITDELNNTGKFTNRGISIQGSFAFKFFKSFYFGIAPKIINEKLYTEKASSYALDFGLILNPFNKNFYIGTSVLNLGPKIGFISVKDPLPLTYRFGWGLKLHPLGSSLIIANDFYSITPENSRFISVGIEWTLFKILSLRTGYKYSNDWDSVNALNFGIGFNIASMKVDYAYANKENLGQEHWISFSFAFQPFYIKENRNLKKKKYIFQEKIQEDKVSADKVKVKELQEMKKPPKIPQKDEFDIANIFYKNKQYNEAEKYFLLYLKKHPDSFDANYLLAKVYEKLKDFNKSEIYLNKALKILQIDN